MQKLLFTGGTGFLGHNVKPMLDKRYEVTTIGITDKDMLRANLAKEVPTLPEFYDVVLHAAGKAHMYPKTEEERQAFYDVNYQGTVNLCKALEKVGMPKSFVFISTLDVYGVDGAKGYDENYPPQPVSPYAKSKLMAEEFLTKWGEEHGVIIGIIRPSLIAGPNPPGNLKDMINGIRRGYYLNINKGQARKSLLMVYDIANLVPLIAEKGGVYNACDDTHPSYGELSRIISKQLGKRMPMSIPLWVAKILAKTGDVIPHFPINSYRLEKLTVSSTYSNEKAKRELGWQPMSVLENFKIE